MKNYAFAATFFALASVYAFADFQISRVAFVALLLTTSVQYFLREINESLIRDQERAIDLLHRGAPDGSIARRAGR